MDDGLLQCRVKDRRTSHGLTQRALAEQVGISRQALIAIEQCRQVPSTALALRLSRALSCAVEDLFGLPGQRALTATLGVRAGASRVALGRVGDRWAAHGLASPAAPSDGLVVGRLPDGKVQIEPLAAPHELENHVLVAGCAPLLGLLTGRLRGGAARATWVPTHSGDSLSLLEQGLVHVAGVHLATPGAPGGHEPLVLEHFPHRATSIVHLTRWVQGLVVAPGNPLGIHSIADVARPGLRVAQRQPGSGAHELLSRILESGELASLEGPPADGHVDVANLVRWGVADVGVSIESAAVQAGLSFVPLSEERFDLLVPRDTVDHPPVAQLLGLLEAAAFRAEAERVPGYDLSSTGEATTVASTP